MISNGLEVEIMVKNNIDLLYEKLLGFLDSNF